MYKFAHRMLSYDFDVNWVHGNFFLFVNLIIYFFFYHYSNQRLVILFYMSSLGMLLAAYIYNLITHEVEADNHKFKASLGYIPSSRPV